MDSNNDDEHKKSFEDSQNVKPRSKKLMRYSNLRVEVLMDNTPDDLNQPNIFPVESVNETYNESAFEITSAQSSTVNGNLVNGNIVNGNVVNGNVVFNGNIANSNSEANSAVSNNQNETSRSHKQGVATSSNRKVPGNIFYPKKSKRKRGKRRRRRKMNSISSSSSSSSSSNHSNIIDQKITKQSSSSSKKKKGMAVSKDTDYFDEDAYKAELSERINVNQLKKFEQKKQLKIALDKVSLLKNMLNQVTDLIDKYNEEMLDWRFGYRDIEDDNLSVNDKRKHKAAIIDDLKNYVVKESINQVDLQARIKSVSNRIVKMRDNLHTIDTAIKSDVHIYKSNF